MSWLPNSIGLQRGARRCMWNYWILEVRLSPGRFYQSATVVARGILRWRTYLSIPVFMRYVLIPNICWTLERQQSSHVFSRCSTNRIQKAIIPKKKFADIRESIRRKGKRPGKKRNWISAFILRAERWFAMSRCGLPLKRPMLSVIRWMSPVVSWIRKKRSFRHSGQVTKEKVFLPM